MATARALRRVDVAVIGGGAVGSSVAYWLGKLDPAVSVAVIERDPTYTMASSALSVGSLRQQFSLAENIKMSQFGLSFIRDTLKLPFDEGGYSFLAPPGAGAEILRENVALQRSLGAPVELLDGASAVAARFPWLSTNGVEAASVGLSGEGWFDPYLLTTELRRAAQGQGAEFVRGAVCGVDVGDGGRVERVRVASGAGAEAGPVEEIECGSAVVAAGCWSAEVVAMALASAGASSSASSSSVSSPEAAKEALGRIMPVAPRKRQVFAFRCAERLDPPVPLLVDVTGMYVRRDGNPDACAYICGGMEGRVSPDPDRQGTASDLEVDHTYFEEHLWPRLADRVPAFGAIKATSAWAGFYEYNWWDHNALLNKVPGFANLLAATGFSGHGVQQAPAAGKATAEMLLHGEYRTQPGLTVFDTSRVSDGVKVLERNIV